MPKEKEEFQQEIKKIVDCDSEQLVNSAVNVFEQIDVPELEAAKQMLLKRQEEVKNKCK